MKNKNFSVKNYIIKSINILSYVFAILFVVLSITITCFACSSTSSSDSSIYETTSSTEVVSPRKKSISSKSFDDVPLTYSFGDKLDYSSSYYTLGVSLSAPVSSLNKVASFFNYLANQDVTVGVLSVSNSSYFSYSGTGFNPTLHTSAIYSLKAGTSTFSYNTSGSFSYFDINNTHILTFAGGPSDTLVTFVYFTARQNFSSASSFIDSSFSFNYIFSSFDYLSFATSSTSSLGTFYSTTKDIPSAFIYAYLQPLPALHSLWLANDYKDFSFYIFGFLKGSSSLVSFPFSSHFSYNDKGEYFVNFFGSSYSLPSSDVPSSFSLSRVSSSYFFVDIDSRFDSIWHGDFSSSILALPFVSLSIPLRQVFNLIYINTFGINYENLAYFQFAFSKGLFIDAVDWGVSNVTTPDGPSSSIADYTLSSSFTSLDSVFRIDSSRSVTATTLRIRYSQLYSYYYNYNQPTNLVPSSSIQEVGTFPEFPFSVSSGYDKFFNFFCKIIYTPDSSFPSFGGSDSPSIPENILLGDFYTLISDALSSLTSLFSVSILPSITIGTLLFVPLLITIILFIVRLFRS